ncbi:MAG TPA: 23S rRNA (uracil(1939)-C(5))-methyltransferase RlmD, partial [Candidatus Polarisedimenticolia bacterium]
DQIRSILTRIAGIASPPVAETVISAEAWAYRFRIDFEWSRAGRGLRLGLHRRGQAHAIVPIDRCHLISERANRFARYLAAAASRLGLTAWDREKRTGFLRRASIQDARGSGEILLTLDTGRGEPQALKQLAEDLRAEFPRLAGVVRREIDRGGRQVEISIVSGRDHLFEIVEGDRFMVPAGAFFQPNVHLSGTLRAMALSALAPRTSETILELFCGVGFLTRSLAPRVREITAVEGSREAVAAARVNLSGGSPGTARFLAGDVATLLPDLLEQTVWDAIVVDPPRTGLPRGTAERISAAGVGRLVYVSCDPATLARDLKIVMAGGAYRLIAVAPVDLFPQTHHVECVATLVRAS